MSKRFVDAHAHAIVRHLHQTGHDPAARLISYDDPGYDRVWCDSDAAPHRGISPDGRPMLQVETKLSANELHRIAERLGLSLSAWEIRR